MLTSSTRCCSARTSSSERTGSRLVRAVRAGCFSMMRASSIFFRKPIRKDDILPYLFKDFYSRGDVPRGGYQPKYIVDQVIAQCEYEDIPVKLDKNLVRMAWLNLFAN